MYICSERLQNIKAIYSRFTMMISHRLKDFIRSYFNGMPNIASASTCSYIEQGIGVEELEREMFSSPFEGPVEDRRNLHRDYNAWSADFRKATRKAFK